MARERWWGVVLLVAVLVAGGTSLLSWSNIRAGDLAPRFHWPDETTNAFFASRVAHGESLIVPEPRNVVSENSIHPRTANVRVDGALVPGAYLGMPLWYGMFGRIVGEQAMQFISPFLIAGGIIAFASLLLRIVGQRTALIGMMLLAFAPPLWLFTATAWLPNVPFVALLLMGFAVIAGQQSLRRWFLGGLLIGLALTMRTHELVWVGGGIGAVVWSVRSHYRALGSGQERRSRRARFLLRLVLCGIGFALPFLPVLFLNAQLYGDPFTTGYALLHEGGALPTEFVSVSPFGPFQVFLAPFGWDIGASLRHFWEYIIVPYWWLAALAAVGLFAGIEKRRAAGMKRAAIGSVVFSLWGILFYGSWTIADPLVRASNVLTISYTRYWLPVIVVMAAWAALGLQWLMDRTPVRVRHFVIAVLFISVAMLASAPIILDPTEGLVAQQQQLAAHRARARAVVETTEFNAVIISHRMDKVFFPERAVISLPETLDEEFLGQLNALFAVAPVYWYAPSVPVVPGIHTEQVGTMPFHEQLVRVTPL